MKRRLKTRLWEHKMAIAVLTAVLLLAVPVAPASASPLTISLVAAGNITDTSATITWVTDELATSMVNYGNTTDLGSTASDGTLITDHAISLTNLTPDMLYYYEVSSTNEEGNTTVDNNGGAYYTFTTAAPGTPPLTISSVAAGNITDTSATITWITNELATSLVNYGNTTTLGSTVSDGTLVTDHAITLTNLTPATLYYYEVSSTNAEGNTTVDSNGGAYYTFTTAAPGTPPLTLSSVAAGNITDTSATITWITDQLGNSTVNYGTTTALGSIVSDGAFTFNHAINLTGLTPDTLYYYEVSSTNADGNTAIDNNNGAYYTFTTAEHLELQGWGWCTNYGKIADATLAGYVFVVERANTPESYSMHAVGNLTLQLSDTSIETIALDMYGSRVRSLFYLRQEETGKSASLKGTWIDADAGKCYIGTEGMIALPNPEGEAFKTARLCFVLLRTPEVDVPVKEPGSFVEDLEYLQTTFVKFFDGLIDRLMLTDFADILGRVLAKIMVMLAAVRELGTPYIP